MVCESMLFIILRGCWCGDVLNVQSAAENKTDVTEYSFCGLHTHCFNLFLSELLCSMIWLYEMEWIASFRK